MAYRPQMATGGLQPGVYPAPSQAGFVPPVMMVGGHIGQPMTRMMTPGMTAMPVPAAVPPSAVVPPMMVGVHTPGQSVASPDIAKVPVPSSAAAMKVATTVFVGNISEKASDTLIRQILLRCGQVDGWKRVQDASGKLQGFGFCEYTDPDSTLRALRLLNNLKLGEKSLVAKVDAKTRKELLKYLLTKKRAKDSKTSDEEIQKEVDKLEEDKDAAAAALITEVPEGMKSKDSEIKDSIAELLKGYSTILASSKSSEDVQRERDVRESMLFMAKQSGNLDSSSTLEDMDMEDDMKTLVSDEIKRFRESYQRADDAAKEKKFREKYKASNIVSTLKDIDVPPRIEREREREREKERSRSRSVSSRKDSRSPRQRSRSSRRSRSRSPVRSSSRDKMDRMDREKRRELQKQKERERMMKDDEEYEERNRQRKIKERETIYKKHLMKWQERERRKTKEYEKELKHDKERRDDMAREHKHLRDFLADYDDDKDDQKYYKGTAYARRYRDRELEMESDDRDRMREKDELEEIRVKIIEDQAREMMSESKSSGEESGKENEDDDDKDVPVAEMEDDIPLTKTGYAVAPAYPPIQVRAAPSVESPKKPAQPAGFQPMDMTDVTENSAHHTPREEELRKESEEASPNVTNSPSQPKLVFGLKKQTIAATNSNQPSKLDGIFTSEDNDVEEKPKKKLVPIEYSDDEMPDQHHSRDGKGYDERRREHDRGDRGDRRDSDSSRSPKSNRRSRHSSSSRSGGRRDDRGGNDNGHTVHGRGGVGDGLIFEEGIRDRKLTPEERKRVVQQLVNNIPTSKEEVFKYELKWNQIDNVLIEKRVKPWINKKIMDYIGEQEPILTDFICNKLSSHISPSDILQDIAMVLDDDAEVFIVKLWRLLIYETEAKHLGIAKNYSEKTY